MKCQQCGAERCREHFDAKAFIKWFCGEVDAALVEQRQLDASIDEVRQAAIDTILRSARK